MLTNITFVQENGKMRISWLWDGDVENVEIRLKRSEIQEGAGSPFISGKVLKYPGKGTASVERRIENEWGLYDFTFIPGLKNGEEAEPILQPYIMIGERKRIFWYVERQKDNLVIRFEGKDTQVPAQIVCMQYKMEGTDYCHTLPYEVNTKTVLTFPDVELIQQFSINAKAPYDKAYCFMKIDR